MKNWIVQYKYIKTWTCLGPSLLSFRERLSSFGGYEYAEKVTSRLSFVGRLSSFGGYEYAEKVTSRLSFVGRLSSFVTDESVHLEACIIIERLCIASHSIYTC